MNYENIQSGLSTAFLDKNISSNVLYRPQFISNDYKNGRKVLSTIEDELLHCDSFSNIELKMYLVPDSKNGFHTKGYIFQSDEIYKILVGSSNMTNTALTTNREWNTKIVSTKSGEFVSEMLEEFNNLWNHSNTYSYKFIMKNTRR